MRKEIIWDTQIRPATDDVRSLVDEYIKNYVCADHQERIQVSTQYINNAFFHVYKIESINESRINDIRSSLSSYFNTTIERSTDWIGEGMNKRQVSLWIIPINLKIVDKESISTYVNRSKIVKKTKNSYYNNGNNGKDNKFFLCQRKVLVLAFALLLLFFICLNLLDQESIDSLLGILFSKTEEDSFLRSKWTRHP